MSSTADEFAALPIDLLIAGPLEAACNAQIKLANATADFIRIIGFMPPEDAEDQSDPNALGPLRMATFGLTRPSATVAGQNEEILVKFPLISVLDVPALRIKSVDVTFDMEVKTASSSKESTDTSWGGSLEVKQKWGTGSAKLNISGSVSSHKENTRSTDTSAKYHIAVSARDDGMTEGMQRVMNILHAAMLPPPPAPTPPLPAPE